MAAKHCTGAGMLEAIRSAVANLELHVDEINALNVFPVPDGDTGTNMLATVKAALDEAERAGRDAGADRVAAAVSLGALMGARGNSGVITSQILRGVSEALAGRRRFNGLDLANALDRGARTAYGAVGKPVEGTILTVIREASAASVAAAEDDPTMESVLARTVDAAKSAVAKTPSLLPILREAGVVDSGGQGLFRLFEGALLAVQGKPVHGAVGKPVEGTILTVIREAAAASVAAAEDDPAMESVLATTVDAAKSAVAKTPSLLPILREAGVVDSGGQGLFRLFEGALLAVQGKPVHGAGRGLGSRPHGEDRVAVAPAFRAGVAALEEDAYGYETVFIVTAAAGTSLDVPAIQARLEELGNSVLVGGDGTMAKVHVHNERPDEIIAYGLSLGTLTRITVENLDTMADDVREARASEFVGAGSGAAAADGSVAVAARPVVAGTEVAVPAAATGNGSHGPAETGSDGTDASPAVDPDLGPAIVAVVAGDGLEKLFRDFGVAHIVRGGQTANPSTGELLRIARLARSREVLVLPNNPNVRLAAEQAARLCEDRRLVVVPTRNAAEGVAAVLAYDPDADAATNAEPMTRAGRGLATVQVTEAVRDAKIGGAKVKKGQTIALDPDDGLVAVDGDRDKAVLKAVGTFPKGSELVTVYYGEEATLAEAEAIATKIGAQLGAEVEVVHGGQPHYRYLISAE